MLSSRAYFANTLGTGHTRTVSAQWSHSQSGGGVRRDIPGRIVFVSGRTSIVHLGQTLHSIKRTHTKCFVRA